MYPYVQHHLTVNKTNNNLSFLPEIVKCIHVKHFEVYLYCYTSSIPCSVCRLISLDYNCCVVWVYDCCLVSCKIKCKLLNHCLFHLFTHKKTEQTRSDIYIYIYIYIYICVCVCVCMRMCACVCLSWSVSRDVNQSKGVKMFSIGYVHASITTTQQRHVEATRLWMVRWRVFCHSFCKAKNSSSSVCGEGFLWRTVRSRCSQRCSIGDKSVDCAGHGKTWTLY